MKWQLVQRNRLFARSPPSRAAWIEIAIIKPKIAAVMVAAFTGGVD